MKPFLVLLIPLVALGCGSDASQKAAIEQLELLGGRVFHDDPSGALTSVSIWNTQITDAGLVHLKVLTSLKHLTLQNNPQIRMQGWST